MSHSGLNCVPRHPREGGLLRDISSDNLSVQKVQRRVAVTLVEEDER